MLNGNLSSLKKHHQNDCKRFIKKTGVTSDGEIADKEIYALDQSVIDEEARYDGFYAVCTNLSDEPPKIAKINHSRWEIEECFRIMKTDFKSRPAYVRTDSRIQAHFMTCFLSLILFRYLEKALDYNYTCEGKAHDEGRGIGLLIHEALVEPSVLAHVEPLVGRVDHERGVQQSRLLQIVERAPDVVVQTLQHLGIVAHVALVFEFRQFFSLQMAGIEFRGQ